MPTRRSQERAAREAPQQAFLTNPHSRRLASLVHGMIVPQHVQHAMNHEACDLATNRLVALDRMFTSDIGADVDVADDRIVFRRARESERDHIGWSAMR